MSKHLRYLSYVLRHKWFVLVECWRMGLYWQGITHDLSKFLPREWFAYCRRFSNGDEYQKAIDKALTDPRYRMAWHLHQKHNSHHWQWWLTPKEGGGNRILPMSSVARREMIADWKAMNRMYKTDIKKWYLGYKDKLVVHPETRQWIEAELGEH
jgi:hypothetical protein